MAKSKKNSKSSKKAATSSNNKSKIITIVVAIVAIILILLGLTCCNKDTDPNKLKGSVGKKDKKEEIKKKEDKTNKEVNVVYESIPTITPVSMVYSTEKASAVVEEKDTTAPVVTVNGSADMALEYGIDTYSELGAIWTDNKDGSGSIETPTRITLDGNKVDSVDTNVMGTYVLTYVYTDNAGNVGSAARTVVVADTTAPVVTVTLTNERDGNNTKRIYNFGITDLSNIVLVKFAKVDGSVPDKTFFDNNGEELTEYKKEITENGKYYVYAEDEYGNYTIEEISVDIFDLVTVGRRTRISGGYSKTVTVKSPAGYKLIKVVEIYGQHRLSKVTEEDFEENNQPYDISSNNTPDDNTPKYSRREYTENEFSSESGATNTFNPETVTENGDHWHYFYFDFEKEDNSDEQELITDPIGPSEGN